jgi:hypothetical protein
MHAYDAAGDTLMRYDMDGWINGVNIGEERKTQMNWITLTV